MGRPLETRVAPVCAHIPIHALRHSLCARALCTNLRGTHPLRRNRVCVNSLLLMTTSLREAKRILAENGVDISDIFEKGDLLARFNQFRITQCSFISERAKAKANLAFKRRSFAYAVRLYTEAALKACALHSIDATSARNVLVLLLGNRAASYLALQMPARAEADAAQCTVLDPLYVKGFVRRAAACMAMEKAHEATLHLTRALELPIESDELRAQIQEQLTLANAEAAASDAAARERRAQSNQIAAMSTVLPEEDSLLLQRLSEDDLALVLSKMDSPCDLAAVAATCRSFHRVVGSRSSDGCWQALSMCHWPTWTTKLLSSDDGLRTDAGTSSGQEILGDVDTEGLLALDWQVVVRERQEHKQRWASPAQRTSQSQLTGHRGPVFNVRMADDDLLLTSSEDSTLILWDLTTHKAVASCEGHDGGVLGAWLRPDGKQAVSGGFDSTLRIWEIKQGFRPVPGVTPKATCTRVIVGHSGPIVSVECTTDGVVSTSFDGTWRRWDWQGRQLSCVGAHHGHACGLDLPCGDCSRIATGGDDGLVKLWDGETESMLHSCDDADAHAGACWAVRSFGHGATLCSGATDGTLKLWDLRAGSHASLVTTTAAHADAIAGVQIDETQLMTSSFDSTIKIWDLRMGLNKFRAMLQTPHDTRCTRLVYDDTRIITGSLRGVTVILDIQ